MLLKNCKLERVWKDSLATNEVKRPFDFILLYRAPVTQELGEIVVTNAGSIV